MHGLQFKGYSHLISFSTNLRTASRTSHKSLSKKDVFTNGEGVGVLFFQWVTVEGNRLMIFRALTGGGICLYVGMFILLHTASRGR